MNTSGEAAEVAMRMMLEGSEVVIKLTGSGAKNVAVLLYSIYKQQNKTRGSERLSNMLRSGKPLKVYTFKREDLEQFRNCAKEYGILYTVLKEKDDKDGLFDVLVRADDDSKLARITERFNLTHVDTATLRAEIEKEKKDHEESEKKIGGETQEKTETTKTVKEINAPDDMVEYSDKETSSYGEGSEKEEPVKELPDKNKNISDLEAITGAAPGKESPENANPQMAQPEISTNSMIKDEGRAVQSKASESEESTISGRTSTDIPPTEPEKFSSKNPSLMPSKEDKSRDGRKSILENITKKKAERAARAKEKTKTQEIAAKAFATPVKPKER